ncbi:MAG: hypothetical protein HQL30_01715 [Candidatus Omnitrophica bacterium]|nr:hypothetical protein [Candidatus Omnitrophota bacterium]
MPNISDMLKAGRGKIRTETILYFGVYVSAFWAMSFLGRSMFWDDWIYVYVDGFMKMLKLGSENGTQLQTVYHYLLYHSSFRDKFLVIIVNSSYFFAGLLLDSILRRVRVVDKWTRISVVLFFLVFPVNTARFTFVLSFRGLSYFMFFLGARLLAGYCETEKKALKSLSLAVFFLSFFTESLLMFYLLALLYIACVKYDILTSKKEGVNRFVKEQYDLILLPLVFWVIRSVFWRPYGPVAGHNGFNVHKGTLGEIIDVLARNIKAVAEVVTPGDLTSLIIVLILTFVLYRSIKPLDNGAERTPIRKDLAFLFFGLFALGLSVFPYVIVQKPPVPYGFESRHQMLMPLGAAIILTSLTGILASMIGRKELFIRYVVTSVILSAMIVSLNRTYIAFHAEWYRELSLIGNIRDDPSFSKGPDMVYIVVDTSQLKDTRLTGHRYRFLWEYAGIFRVSTGRTYKIGCPAVVTKDRKLMMDLSSNWDLIGRSMGEITLPKAPPVVLIQKGSYNVDEPYGHLKLLLKEMFRKKDFDAEVKTITKITVIPYDVFTKMLASK